MLEQEIKNEISLMRKDLDFCVDNKNSREIFEEITNAKYLLEHDLIRYIQKHYVEGINLMSKHGSLLQRMDINHDGMVD